MEIIGAILAFLFCLTVFAGFVSAIVEAIQRFTGARERGLAQMISRLFGEVVSRAGKAATDIEMMPAVAAKEYWPDQAIREPNLTWRQAKKLDAPRISVEEFIRRLAGTPIGSKLTSLPDDKLKLVIRATAAKFQPTIRHRGLP